jgi:XTP/dITP diphosphohydrolase
MQSIIVAFSERRPRRVLLASNNRSKLTELRTITSSLGLEVQSPAELGVELEVEETGSSFAENAVLKARAFQREVGGVVLADDSGLVVDALGGEPGIFSARFGGPQLDDAGRNSLVLERMRGVPTAARTARFVAAIAVVGLDAEPMVFPGVVEGLITERPAGDGGFGYDPIFFYPPFGRTLAEASAAEKASVSHRGKALRSAARYLGSYTYHDESSKDIDEARL